MARVVFLMEGNDTPSFIQRRCFGFLNRLAESQHEVVLITPSGYQDYSPKLHGRVQWLKPTSMWQWPKLSVPLVSFAPDVFHWLQPIRASGHFNPFFFAHSMIKQLKVARNILSVHDLSSPEKKIKSLLPWFMDIDKVLVETDEQRQLLTEYIHQEKLTTLSLPLTEAFDPQQQQALALPIEGREFILIPFDSDQFRLDPQVLNRLASELFKAENESKLLLWTSFQEDWPSRRRQIFLNDLPKEWQTRSFLLNPKGVKEWQILIQKAAQTLNSALDPLRSSYYLFNQIVDGMPAQDEDFLLNEISRIYSN